MKLLIFIVSILVAFKSTAQSLNKGNFSVAIKSESQSPIVNATVELLESKDSFLVKVAISNNNGIADFENIAFGNYLIKTTSVNYITNIPRLLSFQILA